MDLGTGGGIQAMLAARHAHRVVGTDINPRALAFARLAMQINGIHNVDLRQGNMFDPVREERFDLIVS
jgi:methylase of polypeptide subunit release factors